MPVATLLTHAAALLALTAPSPAPALRPAPYPFAVGERLNYSARLGYFEVGGAAVSVERTATERGVPSFVFTAWGEGGPPGIRMRYDASSWAGQEQFSSLRFERKITQAGRVQAHRWQIFPDSARYREVGSSQAWVAPSDPLDELAFLYYLRTMPLAVGQTYRVPRYFQNGYNPVQVNVAGRETVSLGDGSKIPCLALRVTARGTTVGVWLSDDARRIPTQLALPLPFGEVTLGLEQLPGR